MNKKNNKFEEALDKYLDEAARYAEVLPVMHEAAYPEAIKDFDTVVHDQSGNVLSDRQAATNLLIMAEVVGAKADQFTPELTKMLRAKGQTLKNGLDEGRTWDRETCEYGFYPPKKFLESERHNLAHRAQVVLSAEYEYIEGLSDQETAKIIVDPRKISRTLALNLHLEPAPPNCGQLARLKHYREQIPALKAALSDLQPLRLSIPGFNREYHRLYRVNSGPHRGKILATRYVDDKSEKMVFYLTDLVGAQRIVNNIQHRYRDEIKVLEDARRMIPTIIEHLKSNSDAIIAAAKFMDEKDSKDESVDDSAPDIRPLVEYQDMIQVLKDHFEFSRDPSKVKITKKLEEALVLMKVRRRKRKGGAETISRESAIPQQPARLISIQGDIDERVGRILRKSQAIAADSSRINHLVSKQVAPTRLFLRTIGKSKDDFQIFIQPGSTISEEDRRRICKNLDNYMKLPCRQFLDSNNVTSEVVVFAPFESFAERLIDQTNRTIRALKATDAETLDSANHEFLKIFLILKIQELYLALNSFYNTYLTTSIDDYSGNVFLNKESRPFINTFLSEVRKVSDNTEEARSMTILESLSDIQESFRTKSVAKELNTPEYHPVFKAIHGLMHDIRRTITAASELAARSDSNLTDQAKQERRQHVLKLREEAKELFKNFDFGSLVKSLP